MITEVRVKNCFSFNKEVVFSLKADMRYKKFASNVNTVGNFNVLKTAGIYGSNNAGKTNVIRCILAIWSVLVNRGCAASNNLFSGNPVVELGITFIFEGREFEYDFSYNTLTHEYIYEYFCEIFKDLYSNERKETWLLKDVVNNKFEAADEKLRDMAGIVARNNILMYLLDTSQFEHMDEMKRILTGFASKIDIVDMNNIPLQKTIDILKNKNSICEKMVNFIKNADLYMDNYFFADPKEIKIEQFGGDMRPQENVLNIPDQLLEQIRLTSVYKGVPVPSLLFDSTGTKKIAALASYIIEALENGRILIIDELDSSIHFKLTRAIVNMFNNELNDKAQMIFTVHDINLMDCKKMFRKEQIWFVHKDEEGVYLYSLAEFTAQDGVRDTTDIIEKYRKGALGALPDPELINSLLEIRGEGGANE
ncbi:MAG: ATP-binding protein [Lachnospiraceae bacterium]|nr:ATP-binding protein [Lachnospiraceae bacterium]